MAVGPGSAVRTAPGDQIDTATLYALLTLRVDVFVVEQQATYRELDGVDLDPTTTHLWIDGPRGSGGDQPSAGPPIAGTDRRLHGCARLLVVDDGHALGRIAVAADHRGLGLGQALVRSGCGRAGRPLHLDAQIHLERWYAQLGFTTVGSAFDWDGVVHVPMRLDA